MRTVKMTKLRKRNEMEVISPKQPIESILEHKQMKAEEKHLQKVARAKWENQRTEPFNAIRVV